MPDKKRALALRHLLVCHAVKHHVELCCRVHCKIRTASSIVSFALLKSYFAAIAIAAIYIALLNVLVSSVSDR